MDQQMVAQTTNEDKIVCTVSSESSQVAYTKLKAHAKIISLAMHILMNHLTHMW